jgi:transcriptional regulator with XRE-family HTH domain
MSRRAHTYSQPTLEVCRLLALEISLARRQRGWTREQLAERVGVSTGTMGSVEHGSPTVGIGVFLESATLLGIDLLGGNPDQLADRVARARTVLALLPKRVRTETVDDDF